MMKKLLLILCALLTGVSGTWAESSITVDTSNPLTDVSQISTSKYYVLYNNGRGGYMCVNTSTGRVELRSALPDTDEGLLPFIVRFESNTAAKSEGDAYQFKFYDGTYLPWQSSGSSNYVSGTMGYGGSSNEGYLPAYDTDHFTFRVYKGGSSRDSYFNGNDLVSGTGTFTFWESAGDNGAYVIYEATCAGFQEIDYNLSIGGNNSSTNSRKLLTVASSTIALPTSTALDTNLFTYATSNFLSLTTTTASADGSAISIPVTANYPFTTTALEGGEFPANPPLYRLKGGVNAAKYLTYNSSGTCIEYYSSGEIGTNDYFCFTGDPYTGFRIYNIGAGASVNVGSDTPAQGTAPGVTSSDHIWRLYKNGSNFGFQQMATGATDLSSGNNYLCNVGSLFTYWRSANAESNNDNGAKMAVEPVTFDVTYHVILEATGADVASAVENKTTGGDMTLALPASISKPFCTYTYYTDRACTSAVTEADFLNGVNEVYALCTGPFPYAADAASITKWYKLRMHSTYDNYYMYNNSDAIAFGTTFSLTDDYLWGFIGDPYNGVKLYNKGAAKALDNSEPCGLVAEGSAAVFDYKESRAGREAEAYFCLYDPSTTYHLLNYQGGAIQRWYDNDQGSTFMMDEPSSITYNVLLEANGSVKATATEVQNVGKPLAVPSSASIAFCTYTYYSDAACTSPITTVPAGGSTVYALCTAPFKSATSAANISQWYKVRMHSNQTNYMYNNSGAVTFSGTYTASDDYMWGFVGNPYDGFQVYNKGAGTSVALDNENPCTLSASGTSVNFKLAKVDNIGSQVGTADSYFCLYENETPTQYLNYRAAQNIQRWTGRDEGSTFMLNEILPTFSWTSGKAISASAVGNYSMGWFTVVSPFNGTIRNFTMNLGTGGGGSPRIERTDAYLAISRDLKSTTTGFTASDFVAVSTNTCGTAETEVTMTFDDVELEGGTKYYFYFVTKAGDTYTTVNQRYYVESSTLMELGFVGETTVKTSAYAIPFTCEMTLKGDSYYRIKGIMPSSTNDVYLYSNTSNENKLWKTAANPSAPAVNNHRYVWKAIRGSGITLQNMGSGRYISKFTGASVNGTSANYLSATTTDDAEIFQLEDRANFGNSKAGYVKLKSTTLGSDSWLNNYSSTNNYVGCHSADDAGNPFFFQQLKKVTFTPAITTPFYVAMDGSDSFTLPRYYTYSIDGADAVSSTEAASAIAAAGVSDMSVSMSPITPNGILLNSTAGSVTWSSGAGNYNNLWTSGTTPNITIKSGTAVGDADKANFMQATNVSGAFYLHTNNTPYYQISVPSGYAIKSYTIVGTAKSGDITLTPTEGTADWNTFAENQEIQISVSGFTPATSVSFQLTPGGKYIDDAKIYVEYTVTDLANLSNNKAYVIDNARAAWTVAANDATAMTTTQDYATSSVNDQFALIKHLGNYYIYSVVREAYLRVDNTFGDPEPVSITATGNATYPWQFQFKNNSYGYININNGDGKPLFIDDYSVIDEGNSNAIIEAAGFDPAAALAYFESVTIVDGGNTNEPYDYYGTLTGTTLFTSNATSGEAGLTLSAPVIGKEELNSVKCLKLKPSAAGADETVTITAPFGYKIEQISMTAYAVDATNYPYTVTMGDDTHVFDDSSSHNFTYGDIDSNIATFTINCSGGSVGDWLAISALTVYIAPVASVTTLAGTTDKIAYNITTSLGWWAVAASGTQVKSTNANSLNLVNNSSDTKQQFAIIPFGSDYYLYSVSEQKYVYWKKDRLATASTCLDLSTAPVKSPLTFTSSGNATYPTVMTVNGKYFGVSEGVTIVDGGANHAPYDYYGTKSGSVFTSKAASGVAGLTLSAPTIDRANWNNIYCLTLKPASAGSSSTVTITAPSGYNIKKITMTAYANGNDYTVNVNGDSQTVNGSGYTFFYDNVNDATATFTIQTATLESNDWLAVKYLTVELLPTSYVSNNYATVGFEGQQASLIEAANFDPATALSRLPITDLASLSNDKVYAITCPRGVLTADGGHLRNTNCSVSDFTEGTFAIISKNDTYYLWSVDGSGWVQNDGTIATGDAGAPAEIQFVSRGDAQYSIKFDDSHYINVTSWNSNPNGLNIDGNSVADDGNCYYICPVGDFDPTVPLSYWPEITYTIYYDGVSTGISASQEAIVGAAPTLPSTIDNGLMTYVYKSGEPEAEIDAITKTTTAVKVEATWNGPFEISPSFASAKWHTVGMHTGHESDNYIWKYDSENNNVVAYDAQTRDDYVGLSSDNLFCFVGNPYDGFDIYNQSAGDAKTLYKDNSTDGDHVTSMETTGSKFVPVASRVDGKTFANGYACFQLKDENVYLNRRSSNKVAGYNDNDAGSTCWFMTKSTYRYNYLAGQVLDAPLGAAGTKDLTASQYAALRTLKANLLADPFYYEDNTSAVDALLTTFGNAGTIALGAGYWRIENAYTSFATMPAIYYDTSEDKLKWSTDVLTDAKKVVNIFKFENGSTAGKYTIYSPQAQKYLSSTATVRSAEIGNTMGSPGTDVTFTLLSDAQYVFAVGSSNYAVHANGHGNGANSNGTLVGWNTNGGANVTVAENKNSPSAWYIVKVEDIDITLNDGTDLNGRTNSYATTYLPFDVTLPSGVKAYTMTAEDQGVNAAGVKYIKPQEIGQNLPAGTAVMLVGASGIGSITATITSVDPIVLPASPILEGTYVPLTSNHGDDATKYLTLGRNRDGDTQVVGFYLLSDGRTIAANRAYIPYTTLVDGSGVKGFAIAWDFDLDGIENLTEDVKGEKSNVYYDLQGRRVMHPKKGIYIVNGKKVMIK